MKKLQVIIVIVIILFFVIGCTSIIIFSPTFAPRTNVEITKDSIKNRDLIKKKL